MKNLFIIYNIIFLAFGNLLFSSIHYMHHHDHDHDHVYNYEMNECEECIIITNFDNQDIDFEELSFSNNNTNLFIDEYLSIVNYYLIEIHLSRAPPIS